MYSIPSLGLVKILVDSEGSKYKRVKLKLNHSKIMNSNAKLNLTNNITFKSKNKATVGILLSQYTGKNCIMYVKLCLCSLL